MRIDPTRTASIRRAFLAEVNRRFKAIQKLITTSVAVNDAFGLRGLNTLGPAGPNAFNFPTTTEKVESFMRWLAQQEDEQILSIVQGTPRSVAGDARWTDKYIQSAYKRGIQRGQTELRKQGISYPAEEGFQFTGATTASQRRAAVELAFSRPIHVDTVNLLYSRTFSELKGVTAAMDQQMSRVLSQGLIDGLNPRETARALNKVVKDIGINRARTIARTETIRAHHMGNMNVYQEAGIQGVEIVVEWKTAGFNVCPDCEALEGRIFTLREARGLIPLHPNCRCVAIPIVPGTRKKGEPASPGTIGDQYFDSQGKAKKRGLYQKASGKSRPPSRSVDAAFKRSKKK